MCASEQARAATPAKVGPSLPLDRYVGTCMGGALEHWRYDSFVTRFDDKTI
jgi:hypothetical protein